MPRPPVHVFWHAAVLEHDTGAGFFEAPDPGYFAVPELHPENAERVRNMRSLLERGPLAAELTWREGRLAGAEELETVHPAEYVADLKAACEAGGRRFGTTTLLSAASWPALLAAAGSSLEAARAVLDGETDVAYALVRPPGHHAAPATVDGYCFFNNVALAAELARSRGIERVAVVDWDVHHGNGTQACFYDRADVLTVSLHMRHGSWGPSHPQTGSPAEMGIGPGAGFNVNVELRLGSGDAAYVEAFRRIVVPVLRQFRPGLLIGACGQDASTYDPNGRQNVSMAGFHRIGTAMGEAADELCEGRLVLVQEGGYARTYAALCLHATLEGVLGRAPELADPIAYLPDDPAHAAADLDAVRAYLARSWTLA